MIAHEVAIQIIQESYDSMFRGGLIDNRLVIDDDTHVLGDKSVLDSIGFVTLFSEIEERIQKKTNKEIYLILDEISEFDINSPFLSADIIASYIAQKTKDVIGQ